ncbi:Flp pilus assembly protein CpaB [Alteribacillus sp. YIM 98480]|uniref:Flp pilus assembly protein CpaB n=1 Tax=Alteribacillus sp. YIM 98480 TaxID=2606599 RepID=UPI00131A869D|nr:Flp pilus assembly protein CpaB [Alteribacillus sp. YIM 98480]
MRPKKLVLFAVLAGLITTIIFYFFINRLGTNETVDIESEPMTEVVIAAVFLEANQQINEDSLEIREVPEDQVHPNAVRTADEVTGAYTADPIEEGEVILEHRIQQENDAAAPAAQRVDPGMRAVSIDVDYVSSVSNLIEPGDYVDVVLSRRNEENSEELKSEILLEEVQILSVGKRMTETQVNESGEESTEDYQAVTLELSVEDTVTIINGSETGSLQLALHSKQIPSDEEETDEEENEPIEESAVIAPLPEETIEENEGQENPFEATPEQEQEPVEEEPENNSNEQARFYFTPFTTRANIREEPSLTANILSVVDGGTQLIYTDEMVKDKDNRSWVLVEFGNGSRGWISSRIIELENE